MSVTVRSSSDSSTVSIEGEFSLSQISEIKNRILQALSTSGAISLDLENIYDADVSALQLFCSIHRTLDMRNKTVSISGKPPSFLSALLERAGYHRHAACPMTLRGPCLLEEATCE
jgi:ABC-type transporter Mla MlaB component